MTHRAAIVIMLFTTSLFISCSDTLDPYERAPSPNAAFDTFIIDVDSIKVPELVGYGEDIPIDFFGTIGNNGCYSFCKFESNKTQYRVQITAYGQYDKTADWCPEVMVPLRKECTVEPNTNWLYGSIYIEVLQPDSTVLIDSVHVGEYCEPGHVYATPVGDVVEVSLQTYYGAWNFIKEFDETILRFIDYRSEYLGQPGQVGGRYKCYWKYRAISPGRTCAEIELFGGSIGNIAVIVTPQ